MVKYEEPDYSFRLDLNSTTDSLSSGSSTTTTNTVITHKSKERIDQIFAEKRRTLRGGPGPDAGIRPTAFENREEQERFKRHLQIQIQRIVNERRNHLEKELHRGPAKTNYEEQIDQLFSGALGDDFNNITTDSSISSQEQHIPETIVTINGNSDKISNASTGSSKGSSVETTFYHARYKVDYLGSLPLFQKATHLEVLQLPLKDLYFQHLNLIRRGQSALKGTLEITGTGLKVQYCRGEDKTAIQEIFNPFPTIAVWAAVKFVARNVSGSTKFAFLPLICDPESSDKFKLFHTLRNGEPQDVTRMTHPPLFACVMRKVGLARTLECHGFVCHSSEDAIVIAANLYQALLENMKQDGSERGSLHSQQILRVDPDELDLRSKAFSDTEFVPVRPPRRKKGHPGGGSRRQMNGMVKRSLSAEAIGPTEREMLSRQSSRRSTRSRIDRVRRVNSDRHPTGFLSDVGDIYTKVALPRSKSFMNVNHKYDLKELFHEMKTRQINSIDDLLMEIVNPQGMSFTDMKPVYKDLLMKLAFSLSRDEIYQRSKNIMRRHTRRKFGAGLMAFRNPAAESDTDSTISSVIRATKKSLSKFTSMRHNNSKALPPVEKSKPKRLSSDKEFNGHVRNGHSRTPPRKKTPAPQPPKFARTPMPSRAVRSAIECDSSSDCGCDSESCNSDTKCYCSLKQKARSHPSLVPKAKKAPEDCESESCAESEKCYCSLRRTGAGGEKVYEVNLDSGTETDTTTKGSLVDGKRKYGSVGNLDFSVMDSPKTAWRKNNSNFTPRNADVTRRKSSSSNLGSACDSCSQNRSAGSILDREPERIRKRSTSTYLSKNLEKARPCHHRSKSSLSSGRGTRSTPSSASNGNLSPPVSYRRSPSDSSGSHKSGRSGDSSRRKMLLVSAVDPSGKVVYRGASQREKKSDNIMSMKKTAEIAALFSNLKLNQTTDIVDNDSLSDSETSCCSGQGGPTKSFDFMYSDTNLENSLGYLP